jgi:hypothetical protein
MDEVYCDYGDAFENIIMERCSLGIFGSTARG